MPLSMLMLYGITKKLKRVFAGECLQGNKTIMWIIFKIFTVFTLISAKDNVENNSNYYVQK